MKERSATLLFLVLMVHFDSKLSKKYILNKSDEILVKNIRYNQKLTTISQNINRK